MKLLKYKIALFAKAIKIKRLCLREAIICALLFSFLSAGAQKDTTKHFRNSIKFNLTSGILYDNSFQFSYERVLGENRSINVFGGYNEFPLNLHINISNTEFTGAQKRSGYAFGTEYRFYLSSENKYAAPHGVYLAPFISYYHFNSDRTLTHTDSSGAHAANLGTVINFFNIGGELGYQFVLGKRFVIDAVVFGPAVTHYNFKATLDGDIDLDPNETIQSVVDAMIEKFPLLDRLNHDHEVSGSGKEAFWSFGFRYNISVGFRF